MNTNALREDKSRAMRTARAQIEFVGSNLHYLERVDPDQKYRRAFDSFRHEITNNRHLTPNQYGFLEGIYERTMRGAGLPSINIHHDAKRRS